MLLILEIILTISAWRKGWKWWALMPPGIVLGVAFFIGAVIGATGNTIDNPFAFIILDVLCIIAQIALISNPRDKKEANYTGQQQVCAEKA